MKSNQGSTGTVLVEQEPGHTSPRAVRILVDRTATKQVVTGFGGNFTQARLGDGDTNDAVGEYILENLAIGHARIGIPLRLFLKDNGHHEVAHPTIRSVFRLTQTFRDNRIPCVASVWDVPDFFVTNPEATQGRRIAADKRDTIINAIAEWLRLARERYGVTIPYVSFSGPEGGGSILLPPEDARYFITRGGAAFEKAGVPTKWILGDTSTGESFASYLTAIMADKGVVPFIGPAAFHAWDALSASDASYRAIADVARRYRKPVWCLEVGDNPSRDALDDVWDDAVNLAHSYARCLTLAEASIIDYCWQFQKELTQEAIRRLPNLHILELYGRAFPEGTQIVSAKVMGEALYAVVGLDNTAQKLRVLLVNTGMDAQVTIAGGHSHAEYQVERAEAQSVGQVEESVGTVLPLYQTDSNGTVQLLIASRSVVVLR